MHSVFKYHSIFWFWLQYIIMAQIYLSFLQMKYRDATSKICPQPSTPSPPHLHRALPWTRTLGLPCGIPPGIFLLMFSQTYFLKMMSYHVLFMSSAHPLISQVFKYMSTFMWPDVAVWRPLVWEFAWRCFQRGLVSYWSWNSNCRSPVYLWLS